MSNNIGLKPCPFCGSKSTITRTRLVGSLGDNIDEIYIECRCGARAGFGMSEDEAHTIWNTRKEEVKLDNQTEYEKKCVDAVSEEKKVAAANFLKEFLDDNEKSHAQKLIEKSKDRLWFSEYYTLGGGIQIRNALRDNGFGEKELGIENLYFIYVQLIERAVMGKEIEWK